MGGIIRGGTTPSAVLVLGAAGEIGRGVVRAAVDAGHPVVAVDADRRALAALRAGCPDARLATVSAAIASDGDAARLAARLRAMGIRLQGVVASLVGTHRCGCLIDQPAEVLRETLDRDLMPHLFAARHLFPLLPHDGRHGYVLVGGPGGEHPWAGYGHCSIVAAALRMMARVLRDEAGRHGLRVQLLPLDAPLRSDGAERPDGASPRAIAMGTRALAMLGLPRTAGGGTPVSITPGVIEDVPGQAASLPQGEAIVAGREAVLPARDLRDARALLRSLVPTPHVPWNPQP